MKYYSTSFVLINLFLFYAEIINGLDVRPCGKRPMPLKVSVDGCEQEPCKVVNKKSIHFAIDFIAGKFSS